MIESLQAVHEYGNTSKTALVTGANSGIGLETVKLLSKKSYGRIILACRTIKKAEQTRDNLLKMGFIAEYDVLEIDLSEKNSSITALEELNKKIKKIDLLILNACVSPRKLEKNSIGMELTHASSLLGHHIITIGLLYSGLLSDDCRIVAAGSEAARGDVPGMALPKLDSLSKTQFNNDTYKMFKSFMLHNNGNKYASMKVYALAKLEVSLWVEALAKRLPQGMITNSISPGATPQTNFARHQSFMMRRIMMPMMKIMGPLMGMSGSLQQAAERYLYIYELSHLTNGKFLASTKGKMAGALVLQENTYVDNKIYQESVWNILEDITNNKKQEA
jgi:NAD(P)-dependent dehydrogenase (short-subunit alcohol dehydrogenase family)